MVIAVELGRDSAISVIYNTHVALCTSFSNYFFATSKAISLNRHALNPYFLQHKILIAKLPSLLLRYLLRPASGINARISGGLQ